MMNAYRIVSRIGTLLVVTGLLIPTSAWAQDCSPGVAATTPTARFKLQEGVATDTQTGLTWMRCAVGQRYAQAACSIDYDTMNWHVAKIVSGDFNGQGGYAGYRDWRLPTQDELGTLVEQHCTAPAYNLAVFPQAPITGYWSASPDPGYARGAKIVHFFHGGKYMSNISYSWAVRLVRGGR